MNRLQNKVAVVTGAAKGIGRAIAQATFEPLDLRQAGKNGLVLGLPGYVGFKHARRVPLETVSDLAAQRHSCLSHSLLLLIL